MKDNWKTITHSKYEWEREALDYIRQRLPDEPTYRAWSNFEFMSHDGAIYECDLLVLTPKGLWLIEIKSRPGIVTGDAGTWVWDHEGRRITIDNPLYLTNRKAKALASLLATRWPRGGERPPWVEPLVFLSAPNLVCRLQGPARSLVCLRDVGTYGARDSQKGIIAALLERDCPGIAPLRSHIELRTVRQLEQAIDAIGIRPSESQKKVGEYVCRRMIYEAPGKYQDWVAEHQTVENTACRVRRYLVAQAADDEERQLLTRAAKREFSILQGLDHTGILAVKDYKDHELGPAVLFAHDSTSVRLDHFMTSRGKDLSAAQRFALVRELAEAIYHAHRKNVLHLALSPQSVLICSPDSEEPKVKIFNWHVAQNTANVSRATRHLGEFIDDQAYVFLAPETISGLLDGTQAADVFSLGALAFFIFSGKAPATNLAELHQKLQSQKGLTLSAALDGTGSELENLVYQATNPDATSRISTTKDFLASLEKAELQTLSASEEEYVHPSRARAGDTLEGGYRIRSVLGKGGTGIAFQVEHDDEIFVLKVARTQEDNERISAEADALKKLQSEFIVRFHRLVTISGLKAILMNSDGQETLGQRLRKQGRCNLDLLHRFGCDLLEALKAMEGQDVCHRDIKPDNISIREGKQRLTLVLFDFSLAKAPLENISVGTHPYLDPFLSLRKPPRWDAWAERYSAGVTLYEMATGILPKWGDGTCDPVFTPCEISLEPELFEPPVRLGLSAFFSRAMARKWENRFPSAEKMLDEWRRIFKEASEAKATDHEGQQVRLEEPQNRWAETTKVALLGLSPEAQSALERLNINYVKDLLSLPASQISFLGGVARSTREEIRKKAAEIRQSLTDAKGTVPGATSLQAVGLGLHQISLEQLERKVCRSKLKVSPFSPLFPSPESIFQKTNFNENFGPHVWADVLKLAREQTTIDQSEIAAAIEHDCKKLAKDPHIQSLRSEIVEQVRRMSGVAFLPELVQHLLSARPSDDNDEHAQERRAWALIVAVFEIERYAELPELEVRRLKRNTILSITSGLARYAADLGNIADEIASENPLVSPLRVIQRLYEVPFPSVPAEITAPPPPTQERLLSIAVEASSQAALSTRLEIYPRGMSARRALQLGLGSVTALGLGTAEKAIAPQQIRERIASRYREAELLPERPALDGLLKEVGLNLEWDERLQAYRRPEVRSYSSTYATTMPTSMDPASGIFGVHSQVVSDEAQCAEFESRIARAVNEHSLLYVTTTVRQLIPTEHRFAERFPTLLRYSWDELFLRHLKELAQTNEIPWSTVIEADSIVDTSDWHQLKRIATEASNRAVAELLGAEVPVLLTHPGLFARYSQAMVLGKLQEDVGRTDQCPAMIILIPRSHNQQTAPMIDSMAVPVISSGCYTRVPSAWLESRERR